MIVILQSFVPHYRESFFKGIKQKVPCDIFIYNKPKVASNLAFKVSTLTVKNLKAFFFKKILFYNFFPLLSSKYSVLVLMFTPYHISTWLLLFTKSIHKKKIILWGHGISIPKYLKEEQTMNPLRKFMGRFADILWLYTEKEKKIWKKIFPNKKIVALNNTVDVENILKDRTNRNKDQLKERYGIIQPRVFIYCARFSIAFRRYDLLIKAIEEIDSSKWGFIIIGDGPLKPDFSNYNNVYDFGAVYDQEIKSDLFSIADIYFQPAGVGLSIVEAMAYGKPVFTFKRSNNVLQCVEYSYIKHRENGMIFESFQDFLNAINQLSNKDISYMSNNAQKFVKNNLSIENMVSNAVSSLNL